MADEWPTMPRLADSKLLSRAIIRLFRDRDVDPTTAMAACHMVLATLIERQLTDNYEHPLEEDTLDRAVANHAGIIRHLTAEYNRNRNLRGNEEGK